MVVRKRLDITGPAIAFITTTVFEWKPVLTHANVSAILIEDLNKTRSQFHISIVGYVIMPSHIHLLLGFPNIEDMSKSIQSFKSISSRRVKQLSVPDLAENGYKLWKPRFDDLIVTTERQLRVKMEYIHNNPVRAGLVAAAEDWRYSSAADWLTSGEGLIKIDKEFQWLVQ